MTLKSVGPLIAKSGPAASPEKTWKNSSGMFWRSAHVMRSMSRFWQHNVIASAKNRLDNTTIQAEVSDSRPEGIGK